MPFSSHGPGGKTGPKLLADFFVFDALRNNRVGNILIDLPPPKGEGPLLAPELGACKHEYTTKHLQTVAPPPDSRPDRGTEYKVATVCKKCRIHATVLISYPLATNPCPNSEYPLHHFQYVAPNEYIGHDRIAYAWQCSSSRCGAHLQIIFRPPRISPDIYRLLTNTDLLRKRYEAVVQDDPAREGLRQATPMEALGRLRKYIRDSLDIEHTRRAILANNKRFMEAFGIHGRDLHHMLSHLGFTTSHDHEGARQWVLPEPEVIEDRLHADGSSPREYLEDFEIELLACMSQLSSETKVVNPAAAEGWSSADYDIERTLAAQGYERHSPLRRIGVSNDELPYFASLGVRPDFTDALIEFAFDRQIECDPAQRPYYFECLQVISESRSTERLHMKVATLNSQDFISRRDLNAAYKSLRITPAESKIIDDDRILNLFQAQQIDLGPQGQEEARQALGKVGAARGSRRLINAARQTMETYEDALMWLGNGANKDTLDDGLLAIAGMKASETKDDQLVQQAISIIAKERKSDMLNSWLLTGNTDGCQMSVDEALRHLGISENFNDIDQSMLPTQFQMARLDRPGQQTEKAIAAIERAMVANSSPSHSPDIWPVGLTSHGNTCYLNSLLQYYFSITPLRNVVLDYDKYKLDILKHSKKKERVGQRQVEMVEIKGGQRFAEDLKHLFECMIKDTSEHVKPEEDLVCRAFLSPKDYALLTSAAVQDAGPKAHPKDLESAIDEKLPDAPIAATPVHEDDQHQSDASSATLQASIDGDDSDATMENGGAPLTPPASPGMGAIDETQQPIDPPPLPPRRFSTTAKEEALKKAQENARMQQDVTEVHDAILFRLRAGITPQGADTSGEQDDVLRDLFKIGLTETAFKDGEDGRMVNTFDSSIQLDVPTEATDIYTALDAYFDLQTKNENDAHESYSTIHRLPPLLQIGIPRIGFDKEGGRGIYKSDACVKLQDELHLDRYVNASAPHILPTRKKCWGWRKQLHALRKEQRALAKTPTDLDGPSTMTETANFLDSLNETNNDLKDIGMEGVVFHPHVIEYLRKDANEQAVRLSTLRVEIASLERQLKDQFQDAKKLKYRLAAVFFHRGGTAHGHYWIYIHDFDKDIWRKYNDERVEEFTKIGDILEANTWDHGTPTYAVYAQDDRKTELIQPVCRKPEKAPAPQPNELQASNFWGDTDVHMQNGGSQLEDLAPQVNDTVNPKDLTSEGEAQSWDEKREIPQVKW